MDQRPPDLQTRSPQLNGLIVNHVTGDIYPVCTVTLHLDEGATMEVGSALGSMDNGLLCGVHIVRWIDLVRVIERDQSLEYQPEAELPQSHPLFVGYHGLQELVGSIDLRLMAPSRVEALIEFLGSDDQLEVVARRY